MALVLKYQALPPGCGFLEDARAGRRFTHLLRAMTLALGTLAFPRPMDEEDLAFLREVRRLREAHPGIETRHYTVGTYWDALDYLLSDERRRDRAGPGDDPAARAIWGVQSISREGRMIRWSPPGDVAALAPFLERIDRACLREHFEPAMMDADGVYMFRADAPEEEWERICTCFDGLVNHYRETARHGEGVLVIED